MIENQAIRAKAANVRVPAFKRSAQEI